MDNTNSKDFHIGTGYVCPFCGGDVQHMIHPTSPPQSHYRCSKCGKHKDIRHKQQPDIVAPLD